MEVEEKTKEYQIKRNGDITTETRIILADDNRASRQEASRLTISLIDDDQTKSEIPMQFSYWICNALLNYSLAPLASPRAAFGLFQISHKSSAG